MPWHRSRSRISPPSLWKRAASVSPCSQTTFVAQVDETDRLLSALQRSSFVAMCPVLSWRLRTSLLGCGCSDTSSVLSRHSEWSLCRVSPPSESDPDAYFRLSQQCSPIGGVELTDPRSRSCSFCTLGHRILLRLHCSCKYLATLPCTARIPFAPATAVEALGSRHFGGDSVASREPTTVKHREFVLT